MFIVVKFIQIYSSWKFDRRLRARGLTGQCVIIRSDLRTTMGVTITLFAPLFRKFMSCFFTINGIFVVM